MQRTPATAAGRTAAHVLPSGSRPVVGQKHACIARPQPYPRRANQPRLFRFIEPIRTSSRGN